MLFQILESKTVFHSVVSRERDWTGLEVSRKQNYFIRLTEIARGAHTILARKMTRMLSIRRNWIKKIEKNSDFSTLVWLETTVFPAIRQKNHF
jgi:hypothetical protein